MAANARTSEVTNARTARGIGDRMATLPSELLFGLRLDGFVDLLDEQLLQRVDAATHRAARGVLVAAAAELLRDGADVDLLLRPHADAVLVAFDLLEEHDGPDFLHGEWQVDQPFGVFV